MAEQYSNLNVHGKITQKAEQGTSSDDVVKVGGMTPLTSKPTTSTGATNAYYKGQIAVVDGATYLCTNVSNNAGDDPPTSSTVWTYTWTPMSSPDNVVGPSSSTDGHVAVFDGATGKAIKDSGFTIGKSVPADAAFTDVHVTAVGNHYTPSGGTTTTASGGTDTDLTNLASGSGIDVVVGVIKDAAGHVTGVTSKALRSVNTITTASDSGTGNLVTGVTANNGTLTISKGVKYSTDVDGLVSNGTYIVQRQNNGQITVPSTPSADTDAASKAFVNSSISTNTATFLGTYDAVSDLELTLPTTNSAIAAAIKTKIAFPTGYPTNNDYVFISINLSATTDVDEYRRFKYSSADTAWVYEYTLNNSSFTQAQWDAVNSGITAAKVDKLDGIEAGAEVNVQADWNQATTTADDYIKNKPTIGSANFKVQGQGTDASTFSANATSAVTLNIKQGGATTVTASTNEITISSTDQSVTSSTNHYSPSTASGQDKSASASGATAAWSIDVVKGVTLNTDGKGHVTGISVTSGKIPANPNTDAKTSSSNSTSKLFLVGATTQSTSGQTTYSNSAVYATNGALVANSFNGVGLNDNLNGDISITGLGSTQLIIPENSGYVLGDACVKGVTDSSSASAIGTGTSLPTERDIYYGLPTINNSHAYTSSTTIYAPSGAGTANQILKSSGGTSAPVWTDITSLMPIAATDVPLADM